MTLTSTSDRGRLDGIDVARALAILGMVTVHFGPLPVPADGVAAWLYGSWYGKASVLFVVVAGIGVALLARTHDHHLVVARLAYRTAWLVPVGLALQALDHPVAVILQYYAVYFLALTPFVGRRDRTILWWAAALVPVGAAIVLVAQVRIPDQVTALGGEHPYTFIADVLVLGYYPLLTWLPPMLVGLWLGRRDLTQPRLQGRLVALGAVTLAVTVGAGRALQATLGVEPDERSWSGALSTAGHSEMPLAVVGATGFAAAVVGVSLWVAARWPRPVWPLAALGRLALSIYVGHLVVFHLWPDLFPADDVQEGIRTVAAFGAATGALSVAWLTFRARGPVEALARWPWQHLVRPVTMMLSPPPSRREDGTADPAPPRPPARTR
jgi:uncharacterized membrane protein YeiB